MTHARLAKLHLGSYDQAVTWFRRAIEANRNNPPAQLVRLDDARYAVSAGLALNPACTIRRASWRAQSDDRTYLAQLKSIFEGLREAGMRGELDRRSDTALVYTCAFSIIWFGSGAPSQTSPNIGEIAMEMPALNDRK
jgi:hypothetical protein